MNSVSLSVHSITRIMFKKKLFKNRPFENSASVMVTMASVLKVLVLFLGYLMVIWADNGTAQGSDGAPPTGPDQDGSKPPGAIASFIKMIMDLPMGLVEVFKDAADAIEAVVVAFMRGLL